MPVAGGASGRESEPREGASVFGLPLARNVVCTQGVEITIPRRTVREQRGWEQRMGRGILADRVEGMLGR